MKLDIQKIKTTRDINQKHIDQLKMRASKPETEPADRESYKNQIIEIENNTPDELLAPRLWTDDVTNAYRLLCDHNERMSLISDEGRTFEVMAGLYNNGRSNVNVFLQASCRFAYSG